MATFFLHIGTHKTGTTSLQQFFKLNAQTLGKFGYLYPQAGRIQGYNFAHHGLAWQILAQRTITESSDPHVAIPEWLEVSRKAHDQMLFKSTGQSFTVKGEWESLLAEIDEKVINEKAIDKIILSSEDFLVFNSAEIRHLQSQLHPHTVKIVIYLRALQDFTLSLYQEAVKKGCQKSFEQFLQAYELFFNYDRLLKPWIQIFGQDNIFIIPYHKGSQKNNIILQFLDQIGIDLTPENLKVFKFLDARTNPRSSLKVIGFILMLNRLFMGILGFPLRICRRLYIQPLHKKILRPIFKKLPYCFWFNPATIDLALKNICQSDLHQTVSTLQSNSVKSNLPQSYCAPE